MGSINAIGSAVQGFGTGAAESISALTDNSIPMIVCTGIGSGIGYAYRRNPDDAWLGAKVSSAVCGALFALEPSVFTNLKKGQWHPTFQSLGNVAGSTLSPLGVVLGTQRIVESGVVDKFWHGAGDGDHSKKKA
jgi:hypothetical protein